MHNLNMRKEIAFEQCSHSSCLVNLRNIFGFATNYIDDRIKKHRGAWNPCLKKFQVPLEQVPLLAKQLQALDRSFYLEQIPSVVQEMAAKYSLSNQKVRRQILVDENVTIRYQYTSENILRRVLDTKNPDNAAKGYNKVLIICPEAKILTWMDSLKGYTVRKLKYKENEHEECKKGDHVWISSYQNLSQKADQLARYPFQTFVVDEAEVFSKNINSNHSQMAALKRVLSTRHFLFLIVTKLYLGRLELMIPLFSLVLPQTNFSWLLKRYRSCNLTELSFLIKSCHLARDVSCENGPGSDSNSISRHYLNKIMVGVSDSCVEKIKLLNKKHSQVEYKKLLENLGQAKTKQEKNYLEAMMDLLRAQKMAAICNHISYYCKELGSRLVVAIEGGLMYRSIENYLCEHHIPYFHYEHHHQVIDFNKNPTVLVCLLRTDYLAKVQFGKPLCTVNQTVSTRLENYEPDQYLCLSGVRHIVFPDIEWVADVRPKEEAIRELFGHAGAHIVRHYFILKGTYEEKWMKQLEEIIMKVQMALKMREDMVELENGQAQGDDDSDPVAAHNQLALAQVHEEYCHLKTVKGLVDIDEEFDLLEFQALQEKLKRQSKKQIKQQKSLEKSMEAQLEVPARKKHKEKSKKRQPRPEDVQEIDLDRYEQILEAKKKKASSSSLVPIYRPVGSLDKLAPNQQKQAPTDANISPHSKKQCKAHQNQVGGMDKNEKQIQEAPESYQSLQCSRQDETQQVEIIQVRKPNKKQAVAKNSTNSLMVLLQPSM